MAKKWAEILKDGTAYPDDFTVTLKNGEVMSLGDMRSYDREHEGELTRTLTAKEQELSARERNVSGASTALAQRIKQAADAAGISVDDFIEGKIPSKKQVAKEQDLDEDDPLVGKLVKELRAVKAELTATQTSIKDIREKAIGPVINTYLEDYYENTWDNRIAPSLPKSAKVTRDEAIKYAEENGLKDKKGRLDLSKAAKDLTFDARVAEAAESKVKDLRKKDEDQRVLESIPQPGGRAHLKTQPQFKTEKGATKSFDQVLNDAMTDTELWKQIGSA
jgi:hypothetical protein